MPRTVEERAGLDRVGSPLERSFHAAKLASLFSGGELSELLTFCDGCLLHQREEALHAALVALGGRFGFEFVLYAYMTSSYGADRAVQLRNLTNPAAWMEEYAARGFLGCDPVRMELEHRLARGESQGAFAWDAYERALSAEEEEVIARRRAFGLRHGFSAYCDSSRHDAVFLVSFATGRDEPPGARALAVGRLVVPHLNRCRRRLDLSGRIERLTDRERAVARWLVDGKTNGEIARILSVSDATAKFHVANILEKLGTSSRQGAVSILIAERCLA
ncbi:MAG: LuxR family transcriptional regulator [Anaeromyxobacteraceae bacterium]|nr:LuxR family transcriptional regulator [Anaeromyxobacteraceae bacterium]